jgi:hypothetical protein
MSLLIVNRDYDGKAVPLHGWFLAMAPVWLFIDRDAPSQLT